MKATSVIKPGDKFGRLTVIAKEAKEKPGGHDRWECVCECGKSRTVQSRCLRSGATKSCGCLNNETRTRLKTKHGGYGTPEYATWKSMKGRCLNPGDTGYARYGGRGITVCERWMSFENFLEDMGKRPSPQHSIDRIDNDGNYEPGNCRWALPNVQTSNRSTNTPLTFNGETKSISEWAAQYSLSYDLLLRRLRTGWTAEDALKTPVGAVRRYGRADE